MLFHRMQVEVSKYTEGVVDKALRPNGLPKSLIRYDGKHILASFLLNALDLFLIITASCISSSKGESTSFHYRGCANCETSAISHSVCESRH